MGKLIKAFTSKLIDIPVRKDDRGALAFVQTLDEIPFVVERAFFLFDFASGTERGGHAHKEQEQFLMMCSGSCVIEVDNGVSTEEIMLRAFEEALFVPALNWLTLREFSEGAVCCVLSSGRYDEEDYVRDYPEFQRLVKFGSE